MMKSSRLSLNDFFFAEKNTFSCIWTWPKLAASFAPKGDPCIKSKNTNYSWNFYYYHITKVPIAWTKMIKTYFRTFFTLICNKTPSLKKISYFILFSAQKGYHLSFAWWRHVSHKHHNIFRITKEKFHVYNKMSETRTGGRFGKCVYNEGERTTYFIAKKYRRLFRNDDAKRYSRRHNVLTLKFHDFIE